MTTTKQIHDKYCSGDYQNAVGKMVEREVIYCASYLVSELSQKINGFYDEYMHILRQDDWIQPADYECKSFAEDNNGYYYYDLYGEEHFSSDREEAARLFCDANQIEPYTNEVYEHWIVSEWLADKLEEKGEIIERDFFGLTIWGRFTTGQAILLDRVICDIYDDTQN